jgi:3-oxoacyl-[acyl-carrier protein] reductase
MKMIPTRRLPRPICVPSLDVCSRPESVAHLAGPARWINGQIIYANGGVI